MAPTIVDISVEASPPATPTDENAPIGFSTENTHKGKRRQRLLRGIQRISSSPSLVQIGRSRSASVPDGIRGSLSCVSLAAVGPYTPPFPGHFSSGSSSSGQVSMPGTPGVEILSLAGVDDPSVPCKPNSISAVPLTAATSTLPADIVVSRPRSNTNQKCFYDFWSAMPHEIRIQIFSYLRPKELVRFSRVSHEFHKFCFDGQLWTRLDASEFYNEIPAASLAKIILAAGPFIKDLNIRGCLQIEHYKRAEVIVKACSGLINASLEDCRNFQRPALHNLIRNNHRLTNLNLSSMTAVTNSTCKIISQHCPRLETLNVSWCKHMDAKGVKMIVLGCPKLKDLRAGDVKGFDSVDVARAIYSANNLEHLVLRGCTDLTDTSFRTMIHGIRPEIDILTERPIVPPRKLRHLDLSRCSQLTNDSVKMMGHLVPELEGLQLNGCVGLTDTALEPILASTPHLTLLELEELSELTNDILSKHLAKAPCAATLEHLSVSYCENLGDSGMISVIKTCARLKSVDMDNTRIGDLTLAEAAAMVRSRATRTSATSRPRIGLKLVVYDCQFVTWTGIREVLSWNAEIRKPRGCEATYPTEVIGLKCFYGWQQTVEQHMQRVLRGDFAAAGRLERKWADYMQAVEEAGASGAGLRRRRRRAREAQMLHADEEEGGTGTRRRARTMAGSCAVM